MEEEETQSEDLGGTWLGWLAPQLLAIEKATKRNSLNLGNMEIKASVYLGTCDNTHNAFETAGVSP